MEEEYEKSVEGCILDQLGCFSDIFCFLVGEALTLNKTSLHMQEYGLTESKMTDKQIEAYIERQKSPQKEILQKVRKVFMDTLPNCQEKMAWGVVTFAAGKFYLAAIKDRVHVGFSITGLSDDEIRLFEGTGKTMRHKKIHNLGDIDENMLANLIQMVDRKAVCKPC
jgi:hypothetical protein